MRARSDRAPLYSLSERAIEQRLLIRRARVMVVFIVLLCGLLATRLVYLQVVGHVYYTRLSRNNAVRIAPLPPVRGLVYDRSGQMLAENLPTFSLEIVPEQVHDLPATLDLLHELIGLTDEEHRRFERERRQRKKFDSIPLRLQLSEDEVARVATRLPRLPGVDIKARLVRRYPFGPLTAHVVGYVGRITEEDLKRIDLDRYQGTPIIGKNGIERSHEDELHGRPGYQEIETNVQGRPINVLNSIAPQPGKDLQLTLDVRLQQTALEALGEYNGAVVAIETATGGVLALANKPSFDPNPFVFGISHKGYAALLKDEDRPLVNRATQGLYPPGSTIKPFMGLAGLAYGVIEPKRRVRCPGYYSLPGQSHRYRDWRKGGHGLVDLNNGIVQSCDVYFYDLAKNLGIDRMQQFMHEFGFGERSGIDLPNEREGLYPSRAWKRERRNQAWFPGETVIAGIGQGYILVTPLQLARATAILAHRGHPVLPHLVAGARREAAAASSPLLQPDSNMYLETKDWNAVFQALVDVVHSPRGTARRISIGLGYLMAGKTGTAQVFTVRQDQEYREAQVDKKLRDHALFIAFAPADAPRIAVAVIAENGGHGGSVAAPIARAVIDRYMELYPHE